MRWLAVVLALGLLLVALLAIGQIREDVAETCPGGWDTATRVDAARNVVPPELQNVESPFHDVELLGNSYQFAGSAAMHMHWAEVGLPWTRPELGLSVTTFARNVQALELLDAKCIRASGRHGVWSRVAHQSDVLTQPLAERVYRFNGACCGPNWPPDSVVRVELLVATRDGSYRIDLGDLPVVPSD